MTDGRTEASQPENTATTMSYTTDGACKKAQEMKDHFLSGRFREACVLAQGEMQLHHKENRVLEDHTLVIEVQGMKVVFANVGNRKDAAASILLQCVFELNSDEELDLFRTSYREDLIPYPLFVLWVKIQIHRRHLTAARSVLGEAVEQLSASLTQSRHEMHQKQSGELYRSFYAELISMFLCYVVLPLDGDTASVLDQLQRDPLLTIEEKHSIETMVAATEPASDVLQRINGSHSPTSVARSDSTTQQNGHASTLGQERVTQWPHKPTDPSAQSRDGSQTQSRQLSSGFGVPSLPSWISNALSNGRGSNDTTVASTTLVGRLRQLLGRNGAYYMIASGFALLVVLWVWFSRSRRNNADPLARSRSATVLRNFLVSWQRLIGQRR